MNLKVFLFPSAQTLTDLTEEDGVSQPEKQQLLGLQL